MEAMDKYGSQGEYNQNILLEQHIGFLGKFIKAKFQKANLFATYVTLDHA